MKFEFSSRTHTFHPLWHLLLPSGISIWSIHYRALIGTIRPSGGCPCPLCYVKKDKIYLLGMPADDKTRTRKPRVYDKNVRRSVRLARDTIYEQGFAVNNSSVEEFLKDKSFVPTKVCFCL
jgi:hypothetical protein